MVWLLVELDTAPHWPTDETTLSFCGQTIHLRPRQGESLPDLRLEYGGPAELDTAREIANQFLSAWCWWFHEDVEVRYAWQSAYGDRSPSFTSMRDAKPSGLPATTLTVPLDPQARLALALYREARSVRSIFYEFLGYFKILNMQHPDSKSQKAWINTMLPNLTNANAMARAAKLVMTESDVGGYLYVSGRCAVAHASVIPIANPDDRDDEARLAADLAIVKELAEYIIENDFGLNWSQSAT